MAIITKIYISLFFLLTFSLFAENAKNTVAPMDVYIHGTAFLILSLASLMIVVNVFPKSEAYKKQQQRLDLAMKMQERGEKIPSQNLSVDSSTNATQIENVPTLLRTQITEVKTDAFAAPTHTSVHVPVTKPSIPALPSLQVESNEVKFLNYNKVFDSKSLVIENTCKELLQKLSALTKTKSISIYFLHSDKFHGYMEKKNEIFTKYEVNKKVDLNDEVIRFLKNKLGAFSSNHADAVLPLINKLELFGGIKLEFLEANPNLDIAPIWAEVKSFAKNFEQVTNHNLSVQDTETSLFTLDHFNNILNYRTTLDIPQNLTLVKIFGNADKAKSIKEMIAAFKEIIGKNPEAYKISEDTISIFLSLDERDKISKSIGSILLKVRKNISNLEFSIGSSDYNNQIKLSANWLEKANLALIQSTQSGKNLFQLYKEAPKV